MSHGAVTPPDDSQGDRFQQLLAENAEINTILRQQAELNLTSLHRPLEQFGQLLSRPVFIVTALLLFCLWIALNLDLKVVTTRPWDEPPFFWLQGLIGVLSLVVASTVLVAQGRQGQLAEQRAQLQLQVILLTEQRTAKVISLLEELRRDLPNVRDRRDEAAEVMQRPSDPVAILAALETLEGETLTKPVSAADETGTP